MLFARSLFTQRRFKKQSRPALLKPLRLHAEKLEDRLVMSATNPLAIDANAPADSAAPALMVAANSQSSTSTAVVVETESPWERFRSAEEFETWLVEAATAQWGHLFGQPAYYNPWYLRGPFIGDMVLFRTTDLAITASAASLDYSSTNVQVEGVDEADLIETDGEFLYIISGRSLVIVEAGVGDNLRVLSRIELEDRPVGMYLFGDRLSIVSSSGGADDQSAVTPIRFIGDAILNFNDEAHSPKTTVTVLDISDRTAPTFVQKTEMDGQLVTSRCVDGQLRLVLSNHIYLPMPIAQRSEGTEFDPKAGLRWTPIVNPETDFVTADIVTADIWWPFYENNNYVYETQEEYVARVRDELMESVRPMVRNLAADGSIISESPLFEATDLNRPESLFDREITTIATFDLSSNDAGPVAKASLLANAPQVYSSADSIYVFSERQREPYSTELILWDAGTPPKSNVWKFDIDAESHGVELVAKGNVDGTLLNQFAADEHDGLLRVVTKSNSWNSTGQSLFVLEQVGRRLEVTGSLAGIAPTENLYSVRFLGERAFFVTFRVVDPLFTVDLSDPHAPKLAGELHIPGYSDYLQPIDENHLLAIGRGADERTGQFAELQVSIFDVSDLSDPQLVHRYSFDGGRSIATQATGNRWTLGDGDHHALSYFPSEQILAMPIFAADNFTWFGEESTPALEAGQGGLQVFKIDVDAGFTSLGLIEHDTLIERSVQIGEHLYAISAGTVSVHELTNPSMELGRIEIAMEAGVALTELAMYESPITFLSIETMRAIDEAHDDVVDQADRAEVVTSVNSGWSPMAGRVERVFSKPATLVRADSAAVDTDLYSSLAAALVSRTKLRDASPFDSVVERDSTQLDTESIPTLLHWDCGLSSSKFELFA